MPNTTLAQPRRRSRRRAALLTMTVAGLSAATISVAALATIDAGTVPAVAADPTGLTLAGPEAVSVVSQVYDPGQDSGWHVHSGIHAVAVISGTLTVYDGQCRAHTVEPGRPYVGGQEVHRARNQTAHPVEMVVTYLSPSAAADSPRRVASPQC